MTETVWDRTWRLHGIDPETGLTVPIGVGTMWWDSTLRLGMKIGEEIHGTDEKALILPNQEAGRLVHCTQLSIAHLFRFQPQIGGST